MALKPVNLALDNKRNFPNNSDNKNVSFKGIGWSNIVIPTVDCLDRGGTAASFVVQDMGGMAVPRIVTGLNRNRDKTGERNWAFARKESIREILSGPSTFAIPALMIWGIKKFAGTANNVPVEFIKKLGNDFAEFIPSKVANDGKSSAVTALLDAKTLKENYYESVMKDVLKTTIGSDFKEGELETTAKDFTKRIIEIENNKKPQGFINKLRGKTVEGSAEALTDKLMEDFIKLKKQHCAPTEAIFNAKLSGVEGSAEFKKIMAHLKDYTNDAIKSVGKKFKGNVVGEEVKNFIKDFNKRRAGSRFIANMAMMAVVAGFFVVIPKLYKSKDGKNPGLAGLEEDATPVAKKEIKDGKEMGAVKDVSDEKSTQNKDDKSQPSFGSLGGFGSKLMDKPGLAKFAKTFEFSNYTMPLASLCTVLYGATVLPRYIQADDKHDRREILTRDVTSITAILFGEGILSKLISRVSAKLSGFALMMKPEKHEGFGKKLLNYLIPGRGLNLLDSSQIKAHYSNIDEYKNGINDFLTFIKKQGGDIKKILSYNKDVKAKTEEILGKTIKEATESEISTAFETAEKSLKEIKKTVSKENLSTALAEMKGPKQLEEIYEVFRNGKNSFVKKAKTMNSSFKFLSIVLLVPAFMIWIQKFNEKMTKKIIAKEHAAKKAQAEPAQAPASSEVMKTAQNSSSESTKSTYASFLGGK